MIDKFITFKPPWGDSQVVQLELLLEEISEKGLQAKTGTYTGNGEDDNTVNMNIYPVFVIIMKSEAGAGDAVFSIRNMAGVSYIPGSGFVSGAIKTFEPSGVTIGTNADVNTSGTDFTYLAIG